MRIHKGIIVVLAILTITISAAAQRNISIGSPVTENFDGLGVTSLTNVTDNTSPIVGFYASRTIGNTSPNTFAASSGSSGTGQLFNFGNALPSPDRAAGTVSTSASGTNHLGMRIRNNGSTAITSLQVQYAGEQWRDGNGGAETLTFDYQIGATVTSLTAGTWTAVAALNFTSPNSPGGSNPWDGNAAANRAVLTSIISLNIPSGEEIMLRWTDIVSSAQGDGFGVDDLVVTAIGPSAADATISGRVFDSYGRAISSALISVQDFSGNRKLAYTNTFGYYSVAGLESGESYIVSVSARRYTFATSSYVIDLGDSISGVNFVATR